MTVPVGKFGSIGDANPSLVRPTGIIPNKDSHRDFPDLHKDLAVREYYKQANTITQFTELAIVVDSFVTEKPQDPENLFIKKNSSTTVSFTEYKVLRGVSSLDDINIGSLSDLTKYFCLDTVSVHTSITKNITPGSTVRLTRKSDNFKEFYISEVVVDGGLVPNTANPSSLPSPVQSFWSPPCTPAPAAPGGQNGPVLPQTSDSCKALELNLNQASFLTDADKTKLKQLEPDFANMIINALKSLKAEGFSGRVDSNGSYINNGYRTKEDQERINPNVKFSAHMIGKAVDINLRDKDGDIPAFSYSSGWDKNKHPQKYKKIADIIQKETKLVSGADPKNNITMKNKQGQVSYDYVHVNMKGWRNSP